MSNLEAINKLINRLRGSAGNMLNECEDLGLDDMSTEVTEAVDAAIFECTDCGWWCDQDEESSEHIESDEWVCKDCAISNHGMEEEE